MLQSPDATAGAKAATRNRLGSNQVELGSTLSGRGFLEQANTVVSRAFQFHRLPYTRVGVPGLAVGWAVVGVAVCWLALKLSSLSALARPVKVVDSGFFLVRGLCSGHLPGSPPKGGTVTETPFGVWVG